MRIVDELIVASSIPIVVFERTSHLWATRHVHCGAPYTMRGRQG
jgi:hypothetical protein